MNTNWVKLTRSYSVWDDKNIKGFFGEYRYLSNFEYTDVYFEGLLYPSSEHAFMASKTEIYNERTPLVKVTDITGIHFGMSCKEAKVYGQTVTLRPNWDQVKFDYMLAVCFDKFWRNHDLRRKLVSTGDKYLEELNHWQDREWGVDYKTGEGKNMLGQVLMKVREIFK